MQLHKPFRIRPGFTYYCGVLPFRGPSPMIHRMELKASPSEFPGIGGREMLPGFPLHILSYHAKNL